MDDTKKTYAEALRGLVIQVILDLSRAGEIASADRLEDALDRVDALDGRGPYVGQ